MADDVLFLTTGDDVRAWLESAGADEVWLGFHRVRYGVDPGPAVAFREAEDEMAAAGWAAAERRAVGTDRYAVRFAPGTVTRHPTAPVWADTPTRMPDFSPEFEERFRADEAAWAFFEKQPPKYRRTAIWWVMTGKAEETRERRLRTLVAASAAGEKVPALQRQM